jgi:rhamnulokinase
MAVPALRLAIDLGAGSGRAMVGRVDPSGLVLRETHRFHYRPGWTAGHLRWDFERLLEGVRAGIRSAHSAAAEMGGRLESVGVDSWGVDYGLLDADGRLIENPISYRDSRTTGIMEEILAQVPRQDIFARTGIQFLPFNTLYQLVAHARAGIPASAVRLLLVPDLCHHMLCGSLVSERTNASTTQLLGATDGRWERTLFERLGLPLPLMPDLVAAGTELGALAPRHQKDLDVGALRVIAPATHDTASAVVGTPLEPGWAYISSGTWSLVGVEREAPLLTEAAAAANLTNEVGAFGTVRLLKNVMGLWILETCRRELESAGQEAGPALLDRVAAVDEFPGVIYPDQARFFNPRSMIVEVRASLEETGQLPPDDPALLAKIILDSLALRYASVLATLEDVTGREIPGIHVVGGGALNAYLNQATADASGRPVRAGPVEATAAGNVLVQAIACGQAASLGEARCALWQSVPPQLFTPRQPGRWAEITRRFRDLEAGAAG